jgi:hypothetical protein
MSNIVKASLVILAILPVLCNCGVLAADKQEADAQPKIENPYHGARVLVEALIVEVKPEALEKAGVGPLSKEQATATKILEIIKDKNAGRIQSSQKLAMVNPGPAKMEVSAQKEVPANKDANGNITNWNSYNVGSKISAYLQIPPDGRIFINFKMDVSGFNSDSRTGNQPPEMFSFSWESNVSMKSGIPVIASAIESKDKVTYLILRAHIEEDSLPQTIQNKK